MTEANNNMDANATDDQNVIMEDAQDATPASEAAPVRKTSSATLLMFAIAGLLFAGGYSYANQEHFLAALGMKPEISKYSGKGCCSESNALASASEESCPSQCPMEAAMAKSEGKSQCCSAMKNGLANSLMKKPESEEVASAIPPAPKMPEEL